MNIGTRITAENISEVPVGAMLSVPGRKTPVRVKYIDTDENGTVLTTTSGRVRPGRRQGGALAHFRGPKGEWFYWQATLHQNAQHNPAVEIVGLAN